MFYIFYFWQIFCTQMNMKQVIMCIFMSLSVCGYSQVSSLKNSQLLSPAVSVKTFYKDEPSSEKEVLNENPHSLIPKKRNGKFGYVNQNGSFVIQPEYHIAMFYAEDCNLLQSKNEKAKQFGNENYATVEKNFIAYRINKLGKIVYQYKDEDLGICKNDFKKQPYRSYLLNGKYGVIEDAKVGSQYKIYPKYEYLHILEGKDFSNPMIVVSNENKFGIIDINGKIIIPLEYSDIKSNYSWKLGNMFEVTKDDQNYYYIDVKNKSY